ncbi:hypothetical protein Q7A53_05800 [Halobacillus rhizosphaerae]|uniref:AarF/UbiB family protein n=1 Tax=Halobacillus rhizosphaerae TaxID=3064889 RepID=UPI00398A55DB
MQTPKNWNTNEIKLDVQRFKMDLENAVKRELIKKNEPAPKTDVRIVNPIDSEDLNYIVSLIENNEIWNLELLGKGACGSVYSYKNYAIKILFNQEKDAEIMEKLQSSKYVPTLYAVINDNSFIMSKVDGLTVKKYDMLRKKDEIENFIHPAFKDMFNEALDDFVTLGFQPYDLHTDNVMIDRSTGTPVVIDVGFFTELTDYTKMKIKEDGINSVDIYSIGGYCSAKGWIEGTVEKYTLLRNLQLESEKILNKYDLSKAII